MKYKTLKELADAYKSGELSDTDSPLVVDNDRSFVYVGDEKVFEDGGPKDLIWDALHLLGITAVGA